MSKLTSPLSLSRYLFYTGSAAVTACSLAPPSPPTLQSPPHLPPPSCSLPEMSSAFRASAPRHVCCVWSVSPTLCRANRLVNTSVHSRPVYLSTLSTLELHSRALVCAHPQQINRGPNTLTDIFFSHILSSVALPLTRSGSETEK